MYKAVLFDLDGTLMYTLLDLQLSTNYALRRNGIKELSLDETRHYIGNGLHKLIERAVPEGTDEKIIEKCFLDMTEHYMEHSKDNSKPYDMAAETVKALRRRGIKIAVVTNKMQDAAEDICREFFPGTIDIVIGDNMIRALKPDTEPVKAALSYLGVERNEAVYIGDMTVDTKTAEKAGISLIAAGWGYLGNEGMAELGVKCIAKDFNELERMIVSK